MTENPNIIGQGAYGCIYKPAIKCKEESPTNYITKVQRLDTVAENEINTEKKIKEIKNYQNYFAPIEKTCKLNVANISQSQINYCEIYNNKNEFISNQIKYVGEQTLHTSLFNHLKSNEKRFDKVLKKTFLDLLKSLEILNKNNFVHMDIKENNIMVKSHQPTPIIIDFGLTFSTKSYKAEDVFFMYVNDYSPWTLDQTMISYVINKVNDWKNKEVLESEIKLVINDFVKYRNFLTSKNQKTYIKDQIEYYKKYVGKPWSELYDDLMNETHYWDIYALCSIYYSFINYDSSIKIRYQSFLTFLEKNLIAIPSERKNHKEVIEEFKSIMSIKTTPKTPSPSKKAINNIEKSILKNRLSELKNSRKLRSKSISAKRVITK